MNIEAEKGEILKKSRKAKLWLQYTFIRLEGFGDWDVSLMLTSVSKMLKLFVATDLITTQGWSFYICN